MNKCKQHPDPKLVQWLFCRTCGFFVEGKRMGDATDKVLAEQISTIPANTPVKLER